MGESVKEPESQTPYETQKVFLEKTLDFLDEGLDKLLVKLLKIMKESGLPENEYRYLAFELYKEFTAFRYRVANLLVDRLLGER